MTLEPWSSPGEFWLTRSLIIGPFVDSVFQPPAAPFHVIPSLRRSAEMYAVAERTLFPIEGELETFCISHTCIVTGFERLNFE